MRGAVTIGLVGVLLVGCAAVTWQTTCSSAPILLPSETWSQVEDGTFATAGLKVRVVPFNAVAGREWGSGRIRLEARTPFPDPCYV